ncbi:hypothetical protein BB561_001002 [Smittium simulii]|uniref:N-(5'-phosphoribosyl)anthranilate isomerase n=1 Tax=Smittium simulii TaxID=133385 RepID=A0A2T9YWP7_9FUNG|nr:hypothetical protein BB561_001002 [Smittium simulii]
MAIASTNVKICGVTRPIDALEAAKQGADFIGMIFAPSPRLVTLEAAQKIVSQVKAASDQTVANLAFAKLDPKNYDFTLPEEHTRWFNDYCGAVEQFKNKRPLFVGVFSNQSSEFINSILQQVDLDLVQLHGDESIEMSLEIPVPVIKVFGVDSEFTPPKHINLGGNHAFVLLDTKVPGTSVRGGHGVSFDWSLAKQVHQNFGINLFLAGGLTPHNVAMSIEQGIPWCVDVSSGVEATEKGIKDPLKIHYFIENAKQAD